jgi:thiamine-phosphate pyrophosphorylase
MNRRHKNKRLYPRIWLMTDPRFGDKLLAAIQRLPIRSGVVFRHYNLDPKTRLALFRRVRRICARRGHSLVLAGSEYQARKWHANGFHNRTASRAGSRTLLRTAPVHSLREIADAKRTRSDMLFLSPIFVTVSHEGARPLGRRRFMTLALLSGKTPIVALGGVSKQRAQSLNTGHIHGWAAIDAFMVQGKA